MRLTSVDLPEPVGPTMARLRAGGDAQVDVVQDFAGRRVAGRRR